MKHGGKGILAMWKTRRETYNRLFCLCLGRLNSSTVSVGNPYVVDLGRSGCGSWIFSKVLVICLSESLHSEAVRHQLFLLLCPGNNDSNMFLVVCS